MRLHSYNSPRLPAIAGTPAPSPAEVQFRHLRVLQQPVGVAFEANGSLVEDVPAVGDREPRAGVLFDQIDRLTPELTAPMRMGTPVWLTSFCAAETPGPGLLWVSSTTISSLPPLTPTSFTAASASCLPRSLP